MEIKPGTLCVARDMPSLYHSLEDLEYYAWNGLTPAKKPNILMPHTPVLYVRDVDVYEVTGIRNTISEVVCEDKVVMIFKEDLMPSQIEKLKFKTTLNLF